MDEPLYSFAIERLHQDKIFQIYFYACLLNNLQPAKCNNSVRYFHVNDKCEHIKVSFFLKQIKLKHPKCLTCHLSNYT